MVSLALLLVLVFAINVLPAFAAACAATSKNDDGLLEMYRAVSPRCSGRKRRSVGAETVGYGGGVG